MRAIAVVTTSSADYGIYLPVLRAIQAEPSLRLRLLVSGSHLSPDFGLSVRRIEDDGFEVADRIAVLSGSDSASATVAAMSLGLQGFARSFDSSRPDILVVLGDRFEMFAAALAALPFRIPVAHIHGGEITVGAFDDALRHATTKLSHLHFVSTAAYARRVVQLGEEAWRVVVAGAPALDNLATVSLRSREHLERQLGLRFGDRFLLVTFHPATLEGGNPAEQSRALLAAVEESGLPCIVTLPNADPGGQAIRAVVWERAGANPLIQPVESVGNGAYFSLMALATAMAGNSSSGIIEAASFGLPVVNIGSRQEGRVRGRNVIDVPCTPDAIRGGLSRALDPSFRAGLDRANPYGDGHAAGRIVERLAGVDIDDRLLIKRFVDASAAGAS